MFNNPLEQFEIIPLFCTLCGWSNLVEVWLIAEILFIFLIFTLIQNYSFSNPSNLHIFWEKVILFLENILITNGSKYNQHHLPLIFIIFMPLFFSNLGGMIPYNFTITSHIFITLFFSFFCFFGLNWLAIQRHKKRYLNLFLPEGTPISLMPLLVFIELLSYFSRVLSLAIRLFANMMSGHTLLKILSTFLYSIFKSGGIFIFLNILPVFIFLLIIGMELAIACLQIYVFIVLICIYLKDTFIIGH